MTLEYSQSHICSIPNSIPKGINLTLDTASMSLTGERLEIAMDRRGVDQDDLAALVGCTQGAISKIIIGKTQNSRLLPKIAVALQHPLPWLTGQSDDDGFDGAGEDTPSFEELQWIKLLRGMTPMDRNAVVTLIRSLSGQRGSETLHERQHTYRGE